MIDYTKLSHAQAIAQAINEDAEFQFPHEATLGCGVINTDNSFYQTLPTVPRTQYDAISELADEATAEATRLDDLREQAVQFTRQANEATTNARRDLARFQEQVRDQILEAYGNDILDLEQAEDMLAELDLPGVKRTYQVEVTVKQSITVEVEAANEDEAGDIVDNMDASDVINSNGSDYDWELEIDYVQEA